jgi:hypothetical protein
MQSLDPFWQYIVAAVASVGWFFRLEAKANLAHNRIDALVAQRADDLHATAIARAEASALLAEMRADIKSLLRENVK